MKKSVIVLLHTGYWIMYLLLLTIIFSILHLGKLHITPKLLFHALFFEAFGVSAILPALFGFYTLYSVLFKRFLIKKKIAKLFLAAGMVAFFSSIITELIMHTALHNPAMNWGFIDVFYFWFIFIFYNHNKWCDRINCKRIYQLV